MVEPPSRWRKNSVSLGYVFIFAAAGLSRSANDEWRGTLSTSRLRSPPQVVPRPRVSIRWILFLVCNCRILENAQHGCSKYRKPNSSYSHWYRDANNAGDRRVPSQANLAAQVQGAS